jgi:hypothetical protein
MTLWVWVRTSGEGGECLELGRNSLRGFIRTCMFGDGTDAPSGKGLKEADLAATWNQRNREPACSGTGPTPPPLRNAHTLGVGRIGSGRLIISEVRISDDHINNDDLSEY